VVAPRVGRLLLWYNYLPDGTFDPASMHAGCPVLAGEKWATNIWLDRKAGVPLFSDASHQSP
jgi:prolyl 4-hydroxylase